MVWETKKYIINNKINALMIDTKYRKKLTCYSLYIQLRLYASNDNVMRQACQISMEIKQYDFALQR